MHIQASEIKISVHPENAYDSDGYHIRAVINRAHLTAFFQTLNSRKEGRHLTSGAFKVGHYDFYIDECYDLDGDGQAFGYISKNRNTQWMLTFKNDDAVVDLIFPKSEQDVDRLPDLFWVEPAAVIRSILNVNLH